MTIPRIRPPPQSPRRSRPSSTHSTLSLNPEIDFITFDNPPQEQPSPLRRSSQSLRVNSRSAAALRRPKPPPRLPGSTSFVLPHQNKPFDPAVWKAYVEASFPVMEDKGDFEFKIEKNEHKPEKSNLKAFPQASKIKQYSKLKQQSSIEDVREEEIKPKQDDNRTKQDSAKTNAGYSSLSLAEKRRRFLQRKQTHSAPDTADITEDENASISTDSRNRRTTHLCMGGRCRARGSDSSIQLLPPIKLDPDVGIEHLDDLKYPDGDALCHFCEKECSQSIHDETRLKIVSGGLIQKRDGSSTESPSQYMNLPSPLLQCEEDNHITFQQQLEQLDMSKKPTKPTAAEEDDVIPEDQLPPPSAFTRRKALVSSNLQTDAQREQLSVDEYARRSSTVVYPEMQICPGDLMVYSKAIINAQLVEKGKKSKERKSCDGRRGPWSIFSIFSRHKKEGSIPVLEEFLQNYNCVYFEDIALVRFRRQTWVQFYETMDKDRKKKKKKISCKSKVIDFARSPYDSDDDMSSSSSSGHSEKSKSDSHSNVDDDVGETTEKFEKTLKRLTPPVNFDAGFEGFHEAVGGDLDHEPEDLNAGNSSKKDVKTTESEKKMIKEVPEAIETVKATKTPELPPEPSTSRAPKLHPKIGRQISDLFKRKEAMEKVWVDKGKAEKAETAMARFQKKLTRTQSEKVMNICRMASWKQKEKPIPEPENEIKLVSPIQIAHEKESKRREAVWQLFQTECGFLFDHLVILKNVFMEPLKAAQVEGLLMFAEPQLLFGNLDDLFRVTRNFCRTFVRLLTKQVGPRGELPVIKVMEALFRKNKDGDIMTQAYHNYALNYINALNYLETLRDYEAFNIFEKWCTKNKKCRKLQLTDLLVAPVQHIMKIPLLLVAILSKTDVPEEIEVIEKILEVEENSIRVLDDKMKWLKNYEHLLELQRNIIWPSVLEMDNKLYVPDFLKPALRRQVCDRVILSPRRKIIMEGFLNCCDTGKPQEMVVLLFDDMILIVRKKKPSKKVRSSSTDSDNLASFCGAVYKQPLALDRIHLYEPTVPELLSVRMANMIILIVVNRFQQIITIHTLQAKCAAEKEKWMQLLREAQESYKSSLETTIFRSLSPVSASQADMATNDLLQKIQENESKSSSNNAGPSTSQRSNGVAHEPSTSKNQRAESSHEPRPSTSKNWITPQLDASKKRKSSL